MPYSTLIVMAAISAAFVFVIYCLEWRRRDTQRRIERLVHRNIQRQTGTWL